MACPEVAAGDHWESTTGTTGRVKGRSVLPPCDHRAGSCASTVGCPLNDMLLRIFLQHKTMVYSL